MIASSWLSKLQFSRHSLFKTPRHLTRPHSFSLIIRRIYEIILRQGGEIF